MCLQFIHYSLVFLVSLYLYISLEDQAVKKISKDIPVKAYIFRNSFIQHSTSVETSGNISYNKSSEKHISGGDIMADMLVKLFNIPNSYDIEHKLLEEGIKIKKALAPDRSKIIKFAKTCAIEDYSDEVEAAFSNNPITCYIATKEKKIIGFACYEATAKNFFGPMAVLESERKKGIGKALLLKSLESMKELGYAYAIIGWPAKSAIEFYKKCVDASMINEESSGIYTRMIEIDE